MSLETLRAGLARLKDSVKKRHNDLAEASAEEGGDDGEEDTELKPSRKEASQAAATLGQYIADLDGLFTCKMEVVLSFFGRETRREETQTMVETNITDYFERT
ncbi:hypothetical protein B0H14DRAFT_2560045 [Mycena olivaceomarginata]|nr:hypothetical protein B0H14DRAFT_2560045 [Mycena olivaceomarginata]